MQYPCRRALLKESTSQAHEALDKTIGPFDSRSSYVRYLLGMAAFRSSVEKVLAGAAWPQALCGLKTERLAPLIGADLEDFGRVTDTDDTPPASFGALDTAELLGILYVLEGSAIGARLLYKRAQALGYGDDFGARHLALQARQGGRWATFLALLERLDSIDMECVVRASIYTFTIAETAFERASHEQA